MYIEVAISGSSHTAENTRNCRCHKYKGFRHHRCVKRHGLPHYHSGGARSHIRYRIRHWHGKMTMATMRLRINIVDTDVMKRESLDPVEPASYRPELRYKSCGTTFEKCEATGSPAEWYQRPRVSQWPLQSRDHVSWTSQQNLNPEATAWIRLPQNIGKQQKASFVPACAAVPSMLHENSPSHMVKIIKQPEYDTKPWIHGGPRRKKDYTVFTKSNQLHSTWLRISDN